MLKKQTMFCSAIVLVTLLVPARMISLPIFFTVLSIAFMLLLLAELFHRQCVSCLRIASVCFIAANCIKHGHELTHYTLAVIPFALAVAVLFLIRFIRTVSRTDESHNHHALQQENDALERTCAEKRAKVTDIEQQAHNIIDLFEVAKDFNRCISVDEVIDVLKHDISKQLNARFSRLVILNDSVQPSLDFNVYPIFEGIETLERESFNLLQCSVQPILKNFIQACIDHKEIIRIDHVSQFPNYFDGQPEEDQIFPLWIFPLIVEHELFAVYIVEGANVNDFAKFSIVATQLALQIKKISLYAEVKELSITDGLTNVFLRRHFLQRFEEEIKRSMKHGYSFSLFMLDVDYFKEYNDKYGHLVGDVTLREVAKVIKETVRTVDLIGRFGGEEFVVMLPETDKDGAIATAERLRSAIARRKLKVYDEETKVTISVGVSSYPVDFKGKYDQYTPEIIEDLIRVTDTRLYQAKEDGRNRVVHE